MKKMIGFFVAVALTAFVGLAHSADAATRTFSGGTLTGATGVNVGGTSYDVAFVDGACGGTVIGLFNGCTDFDFMTEADAEAAINALIGQVLTPTDYGGPANVAGCGPNFFCSILVPYTLLAPAFSGPPTSVAVETAVVQATQVLGPIASQLGRNADTSTTEFSVYATFSLPSGPDAPAVPLPAGGVLILGAFGALATIGLRRRSG